MSGTSATFQGDFLARLANRANPLLVRMIRQELRSRLFVATYIMALSIAALVALFLGLTASDMNGHAGTILFTTSAIAWGVGACLVASQGAFSALMRERQDDTWDLVELTGLRSSTMVSGVWMAALVQGLVFGAALAPFMTMGFLMHGVDLGLIIFSLLGIPLLAMAMVAIATMVAAFPSGKMARYGLSALMLLVLLGLFAMGMSLIFGGGQELSKMLQRQPQEAWWVIVLVVNVAVWLTVYPLVLATSQLHHRAADRSTWPRLLWAAMLLNVIVWAMVGLYFEMDGGGVSDRELTVILEILGVVIICGAFLLGLAGVAEPYALTIRQEKSITQAPRYRRWLTWFSGPGAARGRLAYLTVTLCGLLLIVCPSVFLHGSDHEVGAVGLVIAAWGALTLLAGDWLIHMLPLRWRNPMFQRMSSVLLFVIWSFASTLALSININDYGGLGYLSPILGSIDAAGEGPYGSRHRTDLLIHDPGQLVVIALGLIAMVILCVQGMRLRIVRADILASEQDRNPRA